jgi:hypothetical protein
MIVNGYVTPLFTAPSALILWPFNLDLAAIPGKNQNDAWHFEFERIVFFHLHAQYLSLP